MSEWISICDSRRPNNQEGMKRASVDVLLFDGSLVFMGFFFDGTPESSNDCHHCEVTHWQPLPKPPS